ncbi:hypothetical protein [Rhodoblastus sp.]|uniref:hypothetical protein n=1 Tax=Rhodoblastus sp. TaxID=1962975 RepID=UPI003F9743E8
MVTAKGLKSDMRPPAMLLAAGLLRILRRHERRHRARKQVKAGSRKKKLLMIETMNPGWADL